MSGLRANISSAFNSLKRFGTPSSKPDAPVAKPAAPRAQHGPAGLAPRPAGGPGSAASTSASMAPRNMASAPCLKPGQQAHPLPRPPHILPTPEQLGLAPQQPPAKPMLPTPESLGLPPGQPETKTTLPTPESLGLPSRRDKPAQASARPHTSLADLLKKTAEEDRAEKAARASQSGRAQGPQPLPRPDQVGPASAANGAAPAAPVHKPKRKPINSLKSAPKIDLTRTPDATIRNLPPGQLKPLVRALGAGTLSETDPRMAAAQTELASVRLQNIRMDRFGPINWKADLQRKAVWAELNPEKQARLEDAAHKAHMNIHQWRVTDPETGHTKIRMDIYFGGTMNGRDVKQDLKTAFGGVGEVYKATREVAELMAEAMAANPRLEITRVMGFSMGGGTAQAFLAGVQSRVALKDDPALVLFDPQLLNNAQARHAVKDTPLDYDFEKPRGVAVTLDYEAAPHKGLMNIMKGPGGYKSPGLVQLRLGLKDKDDIKWVEKKDPPGTSSQLPGKRYDKIPTAPMVSGPPGLGYHANSNLFEKALERFTKEPPPDFSAFLDDDDFEYDDEEAQEIDAGTHPPEAGASMRRGLSADEQRAEAEWAEWAQWAESLGPPENDIADDIPVAQPIDAADLTPEELAAVPMAELFRPEGQGSNPRTP